MCAQQAPDWLKYPSQNYERRYGNPPSSLPLQTPSMPRSSLIKEGDAPSVVLNLRQEGSGWLGTTIINQVNSEVSLTSDVTVSFWVVDEKMQLYIAVRPSILKTLPQEHGFVDEESPEK